MTTRRTVLGLAGGVVAGLAGGAGLAASSGCDARPASRPALGSDVLVVELTGGELAVVDAGTGRRMVRAAPALLSGDGTRLVRTGPAASGTQLVTHLLPGGEVVGNYMLDGRLAARAVSADGSLVALATPAAPGTTAYRPGPRDRTTVVVAGNGGERCRIELAGNLEPEAFDTSGQVLFVLDYLPPRSPDRYRVRGLDLTSGTLKPLLTRLKATLPPGTEEEMRGEGRQAVYDSRRHQLFTLYTHQPDHQHSRNLIAGVRPGAPHVHAFVHTLSLTEGWAYCVDLPAPLGLLPAAGHSIALSPDGQTLCVVDAGSGSGAVIDPTDLTVSRRFRFPPSAGPIDGSSAAFRPDGTLLVAAGREVVALPPGGAGDPVRWRAAGAVHGIAQAAGGTALYAGQAGAILRLDPVTGQLRQRVAVPGLVSVRRLAGHL